MNFKKLIEQKKRELESEGIVKGDGEKKGFKDIINLFRNFGKIKDSLK